MRKFCTIYTVLEKWNNSKSESFFETYVKSYNGCSTDHDLLPASFADYQFSKKHVSIHLYHEKEIFSINKYKSDGFISLAKESVILPDDVASLIASSESDYLYCVHNIRSRSRSLSFCAYPSIDLSKSNLRDLCPPPVYTNLRGVFDNRSSNIYFSSSNLIRNKMYSTNYKAFSVDEISVMIFNYNCEIDEWFSVPQMANDFVNSSWPVINNDLIYFISDNGFVNAYDTRSSQCFGLPARKRYRYNLLNCCSLNEKIYAGDGDTIEVFPANR